MIIVAIAPVLFVIVGLLMWLLLTGRASELGRLILIAGLIALALVLSTYTVSLGSGVTTTHVR